MIRKLEVELHLNAVIREHIEYLQYHWAQLVQAAEVALRGDVLQRIRGDELQPRQVRGLRNNFCKLEISHVVLGVAVNIIRRPFDDLRLVSSWCIVR